MVQFKKGDKIRKRDGEEFSNGKLIATVDKVTDTLVWIQETDTFIIFESIELAPQVGDIVKNKSGRTFSNGNLYATVEKLKTMYGKEVALLKETGKHADLTRIEVVRDVVVVNEDKKQDMVNQPNHYTAGGIEVFDYLEAKLSGEALEGYFTGNVIKYISRYKHKNGVEDLKKAQVYLGKLIEKLEGEK